jgi:hypothetical protein
MVGVMPTARRAPKGKTKLVTLHIDGNLVNVGMAEFIGEVLNAVAHRSQSNLDEVRHGDPTFHTNAAGELVIYVNNRSV